MARQRIMSGMRPTGRLHLGNYLGALENWVRLQDTYDCFFAIVDWHALTTGYEDTKDLTANVRGLLVDWLSAGLDPERCTIYLQSDVKEIAELHLLLSMITPIAWLERVPTYKEQLQQLEGREIHTYGFLGYPMLQAADILIFKAGYVPVGEDQLPHLELTREVARRFNSIYAPVLPEPQALLTEVKLLPGVDGRKMSKSYGNDIPMSADEAVVRRKVQMMITDPARIRKADPGHPDVCTVHAFHKIFSAERVREIADGCVKGAFGCVPCKRDLADRLAGRIGPLAERRHYYESRPEVLDEVLAAGRDKARKWAAQTVDEVRRAMRIQQ